MALEATMSAAMLDVEERFVGLYQLSLIRTRAPIGTV
jgi:hypothetical protein